MRKRVARVHGESQLQEQGQALCRRLGDGWTYYGALSSASGFAVQLCDVRGVSDACFARWRSTALALYGGHVSFSISSDCIVMRVDNVDPKPRRARGASWLLALLVVITLCAGAYAAAQRYTKLRGSP